METTNTINKAHSAERTQGKIGYNLAILGTAIILVWLGIFKYTPTEAAVIEGLVKNHPLMAWTYNILSLQMVSNLIGTVEIIVGLGFIAGLFNKKIGFYAGIAGLVIFATTLSFLFTTPGVFKVTDGVLVTEFFLLKDIMYLAASIMLIEHSKH